MPVSTPAWTRLPIWFSAQTPDPAMPTPESDPNPTATEPDSTSASMVCLASALSNRSPAARTVLLITKACTVAMALSPTTPKPSWPIRLRAIEMPIDAPTPGPMPAATATDSEAMVAEMLDWLCASSWTLAALVTTLLPINASVCPITELIATAPAPLTATATLLADAAMAADAATDTALMLLREEPRLPLASIVSV